MGTQLFMFWRNIEDLIPTIESRHQLQRLRYLFLAGALQLEAQRQVTERRYRNRVGDLSHMTVTIGNFDLLVPQCHSNYRGEREKRKEREREREVGRT